MKHLLWTILLAMTMVSCKSDEEKVNDLIRNVMFETLFDYQSYEPIKTNWMMTPRRAEYDQFVIEIAKRIREQTKKSENYDNTVDLNRGAEYYLKADSLYSNGLAPNGYIATQRYRCKNRAGVYNIYISKYFIDEKMENIIWGYTFEEDDEISSIITQISDKSVEIAERRYFYNNSKTIGEEFLVKNKAVQDVVMTPSGLQYKVLTEGTGPRPSMDDVVGVHYVGKILNDSTFINTYGIYPDVFKVGEIPIKGLSEALTLMPEGSRWEIYIPQELAFKDKRKDMLCVIPPYSLLVFEVDLMVVGEENMRKDNFWVRKISSEYKSWGLGE